MAERTVAIIPGFAEGKHHAQKLQQELQQAGFEITKAPEGADIIIAHSGGCYLVPDTVHAKRIFLVGYTYWPNRSLADSLFRKLSVEVSQRGIRSLVSDVAYGGLAVLDIKRTAALVSKWHQRGTVLARSGQGRRFFIRNRYDTYCLADAIVTATLPSDTFISLEGGHDDIWHNPTPYVHLIQSVI